MIRRRNFLLGSLGAALALPALESLRPRNAHAAPESLPGRMILAFGGISAHTDQVAPSGSSLQPTVGLGPLFDRGVAEEATLISGLAIPWGVDEPGAWTRPGFHNSAAQLLLCGHDSGNDTFSITGPTADGILADRLGTQAECFRTQVQRYGSLGAYPDYSLSWVPGESQCRPPTIDPWEAYASADYSGATTASADELARREYLRKKGLSVLDLVKDDTDHLLSRIGKADRVRLDAYFTELRSLEEDLKGASLSGACSPLAGFPTGGDGYGLETIQYQDATTQWGHERERASLHARLIAFALQCGVRRSVSFSVTLPQTYLTAYHILEGTEYASHPGRASDMHDWGHTFLSEEDAHGLFYRWHVDVIAELAAILRDTTEVHPLEGDVPLLDSTALVFLTEGGWGPGFDHDVPSAHCTEDMVAVTVGGRLLGMRRGAHVVADDNHPLEMVNTLARHIIEADGGDPADMNVGDIEGAFEGILA
jgi:hypothetical protein